MFADAEMTEPIADGTYKFEKYDVTVADGKVTEVIEAKEEEEEPVAEVAMANSDEVLAKVMEVLSAYSVEMAKQVSAQLSTFKAELKKETVKEKEVSVQMTAPKPNHEIKEPKNLREKLFNQMQKAI
jgi:PHP family Zn ribbon phosphoesterase